MTMITKSADLCASGASTPGEALNNHMARKAKFVCLSPLHPSCAMDHEHSGHNNSNGGTAQVQ